MRSTSGSFGTLFSVLIVIFSSDLLLNFSSPCSQLIELVQRHYPGSIQEFTYVVQAFEEKLAITLPWTEGSRNKLLARIYFATGGVMSSLVKLLRVSASHVQTEKTNHIPLELLASVFEKRLAHRRQLEVNPFDPEWRESKEVVED